MMKDSFGSAQDKKRKSLWAVLFLVLAAFSVFIVASISKGFSLRKIREQIEGADLFFVAVSFLSMFCFILFEALAIRTLVHSFGHSCRLRSSLSYSAADIYFSAITPSATGGQPACAYFMVKDGIPTSCTTISLVFNVALYTIAILICGLVTMILTPSVYLYFRPYGRVLIIIGALILVALALLFIFIALKHNVINAVGRLLIRIGSKLRIVKDQEAAFERFSKWEEEYMRYAAEITHHKAAILKALVFNILQRLSQFAVTMFMYIAVNIRHAAGGVGAVFSHGARLLGAQSLISIGSTFIPIPGAMGFTDLMMYDGFCAIMPEAEAAGLELLSRFVSFYSCVILCFIVVIIKSFVRKKA
ncbi:MAG: flippase-like domain-containing protein [Clostridia bacterium]|nr:flippase-like domain-containing protein [Clostridia bacterium]